MFIGEFVELRLKSDQYTILYDKSQRNTVDLKEKEENAYKFLQQELKVNFTVDVPSKHKF